MIPLAANIPLTLCSVVIRRFIDSYTGRLPLVIASSAYPTASTVALFSGALVCLYHQLRKGTLVKIGVGKGLSSIIRNSRHTIQRRVKNHSWFLRNIDSCRRKCTEAVLKIVQPSSDSLDYVQAETGALQTGIVGETTSLPVFNRRCGADIRRQVKHIDVPPLEKLYSNDSFESDEYSTPDIIAADSKRDGIRRKTSHVNTSHRPLTRHFTKILSQSDESVDFKKLPMRKRRKSNHVEPEDDFPMEQSEADDQISTTPSQKAETTSEKSKMIKKVDGRRRSARARKQPTVQKITRRTRSGRVYSYRL